MSCFRKSSRQVAAASVLLLTIIAWDVEAIGAQLTLTWADSSTNALGFSVERRTETSETFAEVAITGPGVTTFTDLTVADATPYCYRVRAYNATAYSSYSNMACATAFGQGGSAGPFPALAAAVLPSSRSVEVGTPATAFVTIINAGATMATAVGISLATPIPASFAYQTTDPATNQITGTPNTPVNIGPGQSQTYVIAITPTAPFAPTDVAFSFSGSNVPPAPNLMGINTLLLSGSIGPVADIVAVAATLNDDGIVSIPGATGTAVFSVAAINVGAGDTITVSADTAGTALPVSPSLCETDPGTGQCISPLGPSVTTPIDSYETPTFAVFVNGNGTVPFSPGTNRIAVRFMDANGVIRGATSVAARTE